MRYLIDRVSFDPSLRELRRDGTLVPVEPLVFDLLAYLIEHRERVIDRDELLERVWRGRLVSDASIASCVRSARRALGDDGRTQRLIRTVQRCGFRFVGDIERDVSGDVSHAGDVSDGVEALEVAGASRGAAGAARGYRLVGTEGGPGEPDDDAAADLDLAPPRQGSIAVLSIAVPDGDEERRLLARALADDIALGLARTRWLFVSARASAARFDPAAFDPRQIGERLGVRYLLGGSIAFSGRRFRYTATLIDTADGVEVWAERLDRDLGDLFAVQDEVSELVVAGVGSQIELRERRRAVLQPIESLDAWHAYHRAIDLLYRYSSEAFEPAEALLRRAAALDPASSRIAAARSFLYWQRAWLEYSGDRAGDLARAIEFGQQGIALDPLDPQGHWALGRATLFGGALAEAAEELGTAVELNPSFANAHYSLAISHHFDERYPAALDSVAQARRISPYDPMSFAFLLLRANIHSSSGEHEEAIVWARRAVRQPNIHHHGLAVAAHVNERAGRRDEALALMAEVKRRCTDYSLARHLRAFPYPAHRRAAIGAEFGRLGLS